MNERKLLFWEYDVRSVVEAQENEMYQAIDDVEPNRLLNTSVDDLADYFEQRYHIAVPQITDDQSAVAQEEAKVDVSQDPMRVIFDRSQPFYAPGTTITFYVPFAGDAVLFKCKPSAFDLNPPSA
ncbi:MAG: hypothetical protein ACE5FA_12840, partial [Dehalococcoidia bacterium]